jgi:hypothetical protein
VQLVRDEAREVAVVRSVEVARAGGEQAALAARVVEQLDLLARVGDVEDLDAVEPIAWKRSIVASTAGSASTSQNGCAQTATPPASWMSCTASSTVGKVRRRRPACPG